MAKLNIKELVPERAEVLIGEKTIGFRPVSVSDLHWLEKRFGLDILKKIQSLKVQDLLVIMFRLLEDKSAFEAKKSEEYDDDGVKSEVTLTGPERLGQAFGGLSGLNLLAEAFQKCLGVPDIEVSELPGEKKTVASEVGGTSTGESASMQ